MSAPLSSPNRLLASVAEVRVVERPRKAVRDAERALVPRQPQRRRQVDDREVGLDQAGPAIGDVTRIDGWRGRWWRRGFLLLCPGHYGQQDQHRSRHHTNRHRPDVTASGERPEHERREHNRDDDHFHHARARRQRRCRREHLQMLRKTVETADDVALRGT